MLKRMAVAFGIVLILAGIAGYVPVLVPDGHLFGLFAVDSLHNMVHVVTGVVAVIVGYRSEHASQVFFQTFGVIYGLVAVLGLVYGNAPLLGVMSHNWADFGLHIAIAAFSLYLGFVYGPHHVEPHHPAHA
jgi:hypothetical protein